MKRTSNRTLIYPNASAGRTLSRRDLLALPLALGISACVKNVARSESSAAALSSKYAERASALRKRLPGLSAYAAESIPGFQVACILDGEVAWSEGYGTTNFGTLNRVNGETIFDLGSLTKPMFASMVLRLRDRAVLNLDTPLLSYFDYPDVRGEAEASKVTARHVLTHTTGLPNWRPFAAGSPLRFVDAPGTKFGYSGEGFFWLQRTVEQITGIPAARLMRQEVLDPLNLTRSSLVFESRFSANYARGHQKPGAAGTDSFNKQNADRVKRGLGSRVVDPQDVSYEDAREAMIVDSPALAAGPTPVLFQTNMAASLQSTAADYARFLTAFMATGKRSLLSPRTIAEMLVPEAKINLNTAYGLGWRIEHTEAGTVFWHSGYNDGFHSFALGDPAGRFGVVVLTNSDRGDELRWPVVYGATEFGSAAILS